jgi:hypothetical protein
MPRALNKTVKGTKSAKTVKAKTARRVIKPWTKEDVRMLKPHSKARTPVPKVSKVMKRTVGALRRRAGIVGVGLGHRRYGSRVFLLLLHSSTLPLSQPVPSGECF